MVDGVPGSGVMIENADAGLDAGGISECLLPDLVVHRDQAAVQVGLVDISVEDDEMIVRPAGDQCVRKEFLQLTRDEQKQFVTLGKAVLVIIELHGIDIGIDEHRNFPVQPHRLDPLVGELMHIVDVGQARQRIPVELILLEEQILQGTVLDHLFGGGDVHIDHERQFRSVRHGLPAADDMDQVVTVLVPGADQLVVIGDTAVGKVVTDPGHLARIIRVSPVVLAGTHQDHGLVPVQPGQLAETVRNEQGNHLFVNELVDDDRDGQGLICLSEFV